MTPPHFQIGQEVEIIGPDKLGCEFDLERFIISMLWKDDQMYYSAEHQPWYPASSLRLVEELKIGDWVEVIGKPMPLYAECLEHEIGRIFEITQEDTKNHEWFSCQCNPTYPPTSLRKLAPDEIAKHLAPPINTPQNQFNEKTEERLSVIESRLNELGPSHAELLGDVEKIAERIAANEKRLAILEGERPEVISDNHPKDQIHVIIKKMGCKEHQLITYNLRIAKEWCIDVLDSMKET